MRTLLIDNYDSFTYNLFQLIAAVAGTDPIVVRNDEASWAELAALGFDNVVISPGPGRPDRPRDFGVCAEAIAAAEVPLLGVCLGHQGIAVANGGEVIAAPEPVHGRLSTIRHTGGPLFDGVPTEFGAVRYHSLCVAQPLPAVLEPIAHAADGVLMALAHRDRPQWGVQFHPESIGTGHGERLLANFDALTPPRRQPRRPAAPPAREAQPGGDGVAPVALRVRRLTAAPAVEHAFLDLYGSAPHAFWLDSSDARPGTPGRWSFIGAAGGPLGALVSYDVATRTVTVERGGKRRQHRERLFDYLSRELRRLRIESPTLPFGFDCGFVGYLGYELKADCDGARAHDSAGPDAALLLADRLIAFDHDDGTAHLLCLHGPGGERDADDWLDRTAARLRSVPVPPPPPAATAPAGELRLARSRDRYLRDIDACRRHLAEGDSYEICLTNKIVTADRPDPVALYRRLRTVNPAPFASLFRFGDHVVVSSSPERLLRIDRDRRVEAKPIKGTAARGATAAEDASLAEALRTDEKSRAENMMIADLLRNDLGRVCEVGSVGVPGLIEVESFATLHQLVTTVHGRLRADVDTPACVRACFPAGSMTGAPKLRTMELIDALEGEARGPYAGALGYLGLGGASDLSVVIRSLVIGPEGTTLGTGGAIVTQSDPAAEFDEMLLKARAPLEALGGAAAQRFSDVPS